MEKEKLLEIIAENSNMQNLSFICTIYRENKIEMDENFSSETETTRKRHSIFKCS
jgi:hypothetical protein